jgi:hypothetical protein
VVVQLEVDEVDFKEEQKRLAEEHKKAWEVDIQEKHRLEKMSEAKDTLAHEIMTRRAAEFARLKVHASPFPVHRLLRTPVSHPVTRLLGLVRAFLASWQNWMLARSQRISS